MSADAPRKRRRWLLLALGLVLVLGGVAGGWLLFGQPGNVSNPDVEFRADETPEPSEAPIPEEQTTKRELVDDFTWPVYGYTNARRRSLDVPNRLRPPFKLVWWYAGKVLLEFPPVMAGKTLYLLQDDGDLEAITKKRGKVRWRRDLGDLAASSPAYREGRLYVTILERRSGGPGRAVALRARDGKVLWSRDLPSRSESSPVVSEGNVYFGTEDGTVYALRERDGSVRWTASAQGAVKGGLALKDGRLFFADYAGRAYAIRAADGRQVWSTGTQGARFGLASGRFYGTPAVAFGRVYIGNVDGYVYSFAARTGALAWRTKTSGYVYAAPTVGAPQGKPTVYAGSYDGNFYAFDARTGSVRWRTAIGSRISGGATMLGDILYVPDLGRRRTIGLDARTGRKVYDFHRGGYASVITDGQTVFLVGFSTMYAFRPLSAEQERRREQRVRRARIRERRQAAERRCVRRARAKDGRQARRRALRDCR